MEHNCFIYLPLALICACSHLLQQINKGFFAPLYSVFLASTARILHLSVDYVDMIFEDSSFILDHLKVSLSANSLFTLNCHQFLYLQHISAVKPQYCSLMNIASFDVASLIAPQHIQWLNRCRNYCFPRDLYPKSPNIVADNSSYFGTEIEGTTIIKNL